MPLVIEIFLKLYKFEQGTQICMLAIPAVQNRVSLLASALHEPKTPLRTEMLLLAEIQN